MKRTIALLGVAALIALSPVVAQDDPTPEPTVAPVVTVVEVPTDETTDASGGSIVLNIWQVIGGIIAAVSTGGLLGFAGAGVLAKRLQNNAATMAAIEALAASWPPATRQLFADLGKSAVSVGELLVEATDEIAAKDKPVAYSSGGAKAQG